MPSANQNWSTPIDFFAWLNSQYHFDHDVCATANNAKCVEFITPEMDSFRTPWFTGDRVVMNNGIYKSAFCNPPFERPLRWHQRAFEQCHSVMDRIVFACVLGTVAPSTEWYRFAWENTHQIIHLSPRIQYKAPPGVKQTSNPRECGVYVYSNLPACPGNVKLARWKGAIARCPRTSKRSCPSLAPSS